jgi:hypothetical protein
MRKIATENTNNAYTDENAGLMAISTLSFEQEAETFADYTRQVYYLKN